MPDGMLTKECPQMELIDTVLNPMLNSAKDDSVIYKFNMVRNNIFKYYVNHYRNEILKDDSQYAFFLFDVGMFIGTMSYYEQNRNLRKDHIEDLNNIYKKYKRL